MPGYSCAYRPCSTRSGDGKSHFKFPAEYERARLWAEASNRMDILEKQTDAYRLCEMHFEKKYFSKAASTRKRLHPDAIPTIFANIPRRVLEVDQEIEEVPRKIKILSNIILQPAQKNEKIMHQPPSASPFTQGIPSQSNQREEDPVPLISTTPTKKPMTVASPLVSPTMATQTSYSLSSHTPRKIRLRSKIKQLQKSQRKNKLDDASIDDFIQMCDKFLSNPLAEVIKSHILMKKKKSISRRYSVELKQFALALYFLSPRAYKYLSKMLTLPDKRTLERLTSKLSCQPGLDNISIYKALEIKMKSMGEKDKHCILCIDEMAIKSNYFYDLNSDKIIGFENIGNGERGTEPCKNVLVIMAKGLYSSWKQPIAFFFVGSHLEANKLRPILEQCIINLENIDMKVEGISSDMGSNFLQLSKNLGVTSDNTEFELGGKKLVYIFDPCHLIKATRNNLQKHCFCFDGKKTSWSFIQAFYNSDKKQFYRCAPKLTHAHLYPTSFEKMKVSYATQVLSHSVACGMNTYMSLGALPNEAFGTIEVIEKFNCLFDMLNSFSLKNSFKFKNAFDGSNFQMAFLSEILKFLDSLKVIDKNDIDITGRVKFIKCWTITIKSLLTLWDKLAKEGFKYFKTRRLNTDCLENYFGSVRQQSGSCVNPTPIQFQRAFRKLFIQNYFHTDRMNCRTDLDNVLITLKSSNITKISDKELATLPTPAVSVPDHSYRTENIPEQNAFYYVCGYLIKRCLEIHSCDTCEAFGKECQSVDLNNLLIHFKAFESSEGNFGGLSTPPEKFVQFIYKLDYIFKTQFAKFSSGDQISHKLLNLFKEIQFDHPCGEFPKL